MTLPNLSRREALAGLSAGVASAAVAGCATGVATRHGTATTEAEGVALIDTITDHYLALSPESATSLNIDKGARAPLRHQLGDRSQAGQQRFAAMIANDLAMVDALDLSALSPSTRTTLQVIQSAYRTGLKGYALPYGDVAVGGYRNSPYVVSQNTGAYLDTPKFLDTDHLVENAADAEAYLDRLAQYPAQLNGELGRMRSAAAKGVLLPAFLNDKAVKQLEGAAKGAHDGGGLVESLVRRTKGMPGNWGERARAIASGPVAAALDAQIAELKRQRPLAGNDGGVWAQPGGDEYYRYALRASTTTDMTPEAIHQLGLDTLKSLHARMDPILRQLGLANGSVGERMKALANDPRFKFSEGDKGRAEIMAFIAERLKIIRANCRARSTRWFPATSRSSACHPRKNRARPALMAARARPTARSPASSGSTFARPICIPNTACPTSPITKRSGPRVAGRIYLQAAADPLAPGVQCLFRRLGALCRAIGRRIGRLRRLPGRAAGLSPVDRLSRLPPRRRYRHPRQALDPRAGRRFLRRRQRLESDGSRKRGRPLLLVAGTGVRL